ncbi:MAG: acetate kinase, partial [Chromatiaceae bacterium]|nr:acetate kinase [Chromatiaceae bacterium]
ALVFTGGIGENDAEVRARTCAGLEGMGILLDGEANQARGQGGRRVSRPESPVAVLVIPTNEELEIARQTLEAVSGVAD